MRFLSQNDQKRSSINMTHYIIVALIKNLERFLSKILKA